jgi:hypothetical protein
MWKGDNSCLLCGFLGAVSELFAMVLRKRRIRWRVAPFVAQTRGTGSRFVGIGACAEQRRARPAGTLGRVDGREVLEEEEVKGGEDAYNVELAAPVLMLRELERPNMVLARRPAPRRTEFTMATVSLLLRVCDGGLWFLFDLREALERYSRLLRLGQIQ